VDAGADGITVVNTMPGLVIDVERRRPMLGFGSGGVSGPGPAGGRRAGRVARAPGGRVPVIGAGGVQRATDVIQYLMAGAGAVAVGTAALADPKLPARLVRDLARWCERHGVARLADLVGTLEWPR
jgi:dihydroorotate dehydrogenase (NAD+) catalytic subunit